MATPPNPTDGNPQNPDRMDFSQLTDAMASRSYDKIADICDQLMLQIASHGVAFQDEWPYAVHLLGHIYLNDLNSARFLWKSIPSSIKESRPEVVAVWKIGQHLWTRNYAGVYDSIRGFNWSAEMQDFIALFAVKRLHALWKLYQKPKFQLDVMIVCDDFVWKPVPSGVLKGLWRSSSRVAKNSRSQKFFRERYRRRMVELLQCGYSSISIEDTALFLGMRENDARNYVLQQGWNVDGDSGMVRVKKQAVVSEQKIDPTKLQRLTEYVFHLEH